MIVIVWRLTLDAITPAYYLLVESKIRKMLMSSHHSQQYMAEHKAGPRSKEENLLISYNKPKRRELTLADWDKYVNAPIVGRGPITLELASLEKRLVVQPVKIHH